jgi:mannose/fructose/N-acetylgalactosamine-specific phosphotransferase system component IIC
MIFEPGTLVLLLLFGSWAALDGIALGQFMISRPLVAAIGGGLIVGAPAEATAVALVLEALHLTVLPVGAARYPEGGPSAVAAGAVYAVAGQGSPVALLTVVIVALVWERVGGATVRLVRRWNVRLVSADEGTAPRDAAAVARGPWLAIALEAARGLVVTAGGLFVTYAVVEATFFVWGAGKHAPALLLAGAVAAAVGAAVRMFGGRARARLVLAGAAVGVLLLLLTP